MPRKAHGGKIVHSMRINTPLPYIALCLLGILIFTSECYGQTDLKEQLEAVMVELRHSLRDGNYERFADLFESHKEDKVMTRVDFETLRKQTDNNDKLLHFVVPDLANATKHIHIKEEGVWAAYYHESYPKDKNYITVDVRVFHRVGGQWKLYGKSFGRTKARPDSEWARKGTAAWKGDKDILDTIMNDPDYQIDNITKRQNK